MSSNTFGYTADTGPEQSFQNNTGIFDPADINNLIADNKWTNYGQLELIQTQNVSSSTAVVNFTDIKENIYNVHFLTMNNASGTSTTDFDILLSDNGGSSFITSGYKSALQYGTSGGIFGTDNSGGLTNVMMWTQGSATENAYAYLYNLGDSTKYSFATMHTMGINGFKYGGSIKPTTQVINAIQVKGRNNPFATVNLSLYGVKFS